MYICTRTSFLHRTHFEPKSFHPNKSAKQLQKIWGTFNTNIRNVAKNAKHSKIAPPKIKKSQQSMYFFLQKKIVLSGIYFTPATKIFTQPLHWSIVTKQNKPRNMYIPRIQ